VSNPHLKTELPGPNARAMLARDVGVASPSYPRDYPFVMSHGRGTEVWDVDGNRFLDFVAGIAVCSTGHAHPQVVEAIKSAADKFLHVSSDYWHENMTRLTERLAEVAPMGEPVMSFLCQSGTESVEGAIKLARYVTGRPRFIGFLGAFHGRTMGSLSFTSSKYTQQKGFAPTMPGVTHVPYPNPYRPLFAGADQGKAVLDYIRMLFERNVPASEVAAILVEPLQGEGGYLWPPAGFLAGLRALCDEHGILLIFDEVQSGVGRTGRMWACEHSGVRPDIMTSAKGLGSGLPIGAIIAKKSIMEQWKRGAHGNTYGGNPLSCAAAIATLDLVQSQYAANAARVGEHFMGRLREMMRDYACIGEVRGRGLMIGMELIENDAERTPARALCDRLVTRGYYNGLLLLSCGVSTLRFMPPLSTTEAQVDEAIVLLRRALDEALQGKGG
jgi:4-aminobutyrate aminotransferase